MSLYSWVHNLVLPYLIEYDPDYRLASVCEIEEITQTKLPLDITNPASQNSMDRDQQQEKAILNLISSSHRKSPRT
jgi:hypothetical protein